jgi:hypothetical protein
VGTPKPGGGGGGVWAMLEDAKANSNDPIISDGICDSVTIRGS